MAETHRDGDWWRTGCLVVPFGAVLAFVTAGGLGAAFGAGAGWSAVIGVLGALVAAALIVRGLQQGAFGG